jgi:hypothetical protein
MLEVARRGYVELLRIRIRQTSENSVKAKFAEHTTDELQAL